MAIRLGTIAADARLGTIDLRQAFLGSIPLLPEGGTVSPEAQAVLDQMVALSPTEESAIINFVDSLVKDGVWDFVLDCWAPCLNASDFLTDFRNVGGVLTTIDANQTHIPGQGLEFTSFGAGVVTPGNLSSFMTANPSGAGAYLVFTLADVTGNSDYFGAVNFGIECYLRWRGLTNADMNIAWTHDGVSPRPFPPAVRPTGDVIQGGSGSGGTSAYFANGSTLQTNIFRTFEGSFPTAAMQFNGRNNAGATQQARDSTHSFWFLMQGHDPATDCLTMRAAVLQFLRDIGVTGVPST